MSDRDALLALAERWRPNTVTVYRGVTIYAAEESGRRFWAWRYPSFKGSWELGQEAGDLAWARRCIDEVLDERASREGSASC